MSKWTEEDEDYLRENYSRGKTGAICVKLGRTYSAVTTHAKRMGIPKLGIQWSKEEDDYLREHWPITATRVLVENMDRSGMAIDNRARMMNLFRKELFNNGLTPTQRTCQIIYTEAKKYGGDPESLFSDTKFVEDFVGISCARLDRGEIKFDDYKKHHDIQITTKYCCDRLFAVPSVPWDRHQKRAHGVKW